MDANSNSPVKPRFWFGFSIGLMVGIVLAIVFFLVNKSLNDPIKLMVTPPPAPVLEQPVADSNVGKTVVIQQTHASKKTKALSSADSVASRSVNMVDMESAAALELTDDGAFSLPQVAKEGDVSASEFVAQTSIRVKTVSGVTPPIPAFEVEQWYEPVNNKYSYLRSGKYLKIKGMELSSVQILCDDGHYFIEYKGKKYAIPECSTFQRLTAVKN